MGNTTPKPLKKQRTCPTCDGPTDPENPAAPFCCHRCRLADLNKWMIGEYIVSREMKETDLDELDA